MKQNLDVQGLSLVIAVERRDPSVFTPDVPRFSCIIPQEGELLSWVATYRHTVERLLQQD
jgi:hypothetical protein